MPKLSVIVPIFNVDKYLRECLLSIESQTFQDLEIICVNDGSTDNSLNILTDFASRNKKIKVVDKTNTGYGDSVNIGIKISEGKYIGIVEPDDFILPEMYSTLVKIADDENLEIVKSDFYRFVSTPDGGYRRNYNQLSKKFYLYNSVFCPEKTQEAFFAAMNTWCGIYNLDFLKNNSILHNTTPGASFQDNGFWFNGFSCAKRVMFIDRAFYMNRRDNPNSSVKNQNKMFCMNEEYKFIKSYLESAGKLDVFKDIYLYKKWGNYFFTIRRLSPNLRGQYLRALAAEARNDWEEVISESSYFNKKDRYKLSLIKKQPTLYAFLFNLWSLRK